MGKITLLNESLQAAENSVAGSLSDARKLSSLVGRGAGGREVSLAITKLQEAEMWLLQASEELFSEPSEEERAAAQRFYQAAEEPRMQEKEA